MEKMLKELGFDIVDANRDGLVVKWGKARSIRIQLPFIFDEEMAKIAAMILDGSVSKNCSSVMFSQKKDKSKAYEFDRICRLKFEVIPIIREHLGCMYVTVGNKSFAKFLNLVLDIHRSDEKARIPRWIWQSDIEIIRTYLRYAYAMEGSVSLLFSAKEVKFHSVVLSYIEELKLLLKEKFGIESKIQKYFVKGYGNKYYLWIGDETNLAKFAKIGFALASHEKRLDQLVSEFKPKAWKITLVKLLELQKDEFSIEDVRLMFGYLCKRAVHERNQSLIRYGYLTKGINGYSITVIGKSLALQLKGNVRICKLRTSARENEKSIMTLFNQKQKMFRNEISKELKISPKTVADVLKRLEKEGLIEFDLKDKFQRKYYRIKNWAKGSFGPIK
ncbi:winged helix-turn-helix transcriptional regulator [Candidatus Woesearchaeota archaeon]|nr:winged helix-turn-helix transcriptional regulator [Candidatus Woesearchaeota archaeon]